jgi:hypothetical protein
VYSLLYSREKLDVALVIELLDYFGIVVFAVSGALAFLM